MEARHIWLLTIAGVLIAIAFFSAIVGGTSTLTEWYVNNTFVASREGGNFIAGGDFIINTTDNPSDDRVDFTFSLPAQPAPTIPIKEDDVLVINANSIDFQTGFDVTTAIGDADISLDLTELNNLTFGDNSITPLTHTFDPTGSTNPVWSYTDGVANLSAGALQEGGNAVANASEEGILDADVFATCDVTSDDLVDSACIEQDAGTDINTDLEEETHASEHAISAGDEVAFYGLIDDEGTPLTARRTLNFIGVGVSCVDDGAGSETDCTIAGGGGGNSFETIDAPAGTDPVADTATDILQLLITGSDLTITGTDDPETLTFDIVTDAGTDITTDLEEETHNTEHADGGADELFTERHITFFVSGDVTTGVKQIRLVLRRAVTYKDAHCEVQTQGTTSAIEINFQENTNDIFSDANRVSIAAASDGDTSSAPTDTTGAADDVIELIIDSEDSGNTGADITCELRIRHPVDSSG